VQDPQCATIGDAAKLEVMVAAGVRNASSVLITTHDDDTNIYLTILYRRLRPNLQIITRCASEHNVQTLHRAGADLVLSYASMGANTIFNELRGSDSLLLAEGVNLFPAKVPARAAGRTIRDTSIRSETGCTIIAVGKAANRVINPPPDTLLEPNTEILLVGTLEAEERFHARFMPGEQRAAAT
jgi:Trk K+ transport system NAD-binding subunit